MIRGGFGEKKLIIVIKMVKPFYRGHFLNDILFHFQNMEMIKISSTIENI